MLPEQIKAWRFYGFGDMRLDTIPMPEVKPGWVLLKTRVVQMSITEVIRSLGLNTTGADFVRKAITERAPVQLFGHEFCAEVVAVGDGVENFKPGDRVVPGAKVPCGECALCKSGATHLCRRGASIGREIPGLLCEYATIPTVVLAKVPATVSDSEGACLQPLTSSMSAVETAQIQIGDTVAVYGQGVMGLGCAQAARVSGARKVIGVDIRKESLELARKLGIDEVIDSTKEDPVKAILELTDGFGADVVFEAAGGSRKQGLAGTDTIPPAINSVRDCGKLVQVAVIGEPVTLDHIALRKKNIAFMWPHPPTHRTMAQCIALVATKRVQVAPMVTHLLPGISRVPEAFEITGNKVKYGALNPAQVMISEG